MIVWEIARVVVGHRIKADEEKLAGLLAAGWEPFAVSSSQHEGYVYHFRRVAKK